MSLGALGCVDVESSCKLLFLGAVFGALAFLQVLCSLLGGASLTQLYNATMNISSGIIFSCF